ncbi:SOS response-associated peptidase [Thiolapillus sp.]|uniref:SOS response-associated peptidase n=2 Tax=Thiolapillus sp. TaxID=2017437 RepID=UPI003AF4A3BC
MVATIYSLHNRKSSRIFNCQAFPNTRSATTLTPGQSILNVVQLADGGRKGVNLQWGLLPSWCKDRRIASHMINARRETLAKKPAFRSAFRKRCCLIPATGFYEWQQTPAGKQPHHTYPPPRQQPVRLRRPLGALGKGNRKHLFRKRQRISPLAAY